MKVHFLGTGTSQGIPVIGSKNPVSLSDDPRDTRLRTSIAIEWEDLQLVIDCGPDFRQQMLQLGWDRLDALLFTHEHADHTAGLDDIRPYCHQQGALDIYLQQRVLKALQRRFDYVFATENRYPGAPSVHAHVVGENDAFQIKNKAVQPLSILHGDLPILGFRFANLVYITDAKTIPEVEFDKLRDVKILVINALRISLHPMHFNLEEVLEVIARINPEQAYITHIGQDLGFHEKVQKTLPKNVYLAHDNLQLELDD